MLILFRYGNNDLKQPEIVIMKAKNRYLILFFTLILFLSFLYILMKVRKKVTKIQPFQHNTFLSIEDLEELESRVDQVEDMNPTLCRMETCFNFTRCSQSFKVRFIFKESSFYTAEADEACLFVLSLDTLDRDPLSQDFIRNMQFRVEALPYWNGGENHLIFNLYSGTWPHYTEDLGFNIGKAILAKASIAVENYRPRFDISLPLFHRTHPEKGGEPGFVKSTNFPGVHKYFLAFKGKRYVHGIGSEVRNSLYHLHNGKDVALVTTCKHGKNWKEMQDDRCEMDNDEYDKWDYNQLLANSTFCLVPRGRRLGSFRFLETLQAGCVPVLLSNSWQLPFGEVIDWTLATISIDERQLLQVPEILRMVSQPQIFKLRQQTQIVWDQYLSSVRSIMLTTLEIIRQRINLHSASSLQVWNSRPGIFFTKREEDEGSDRVCMVISTVSETPVSSSRSPILRIIQSASQTGFIRESLVLWSSNSTPPPLEDWYRFSSSNPGKLNIRIIQTNGTKLDKFKVASQCKSSTVFAVDDDITIAREEIVFAYTVFKDFDDRLVGFTPRVHYWDGDTQRWKYSSRPSSSFSIINTNAALFHKKYAEIFHSYLPRKMIKFLSDFPHCEDILFNFLISQITKKAPVKVTQRKRLSSSKIEDRGRMIREFDEKQSCMMRFFEDFGEMALVVSQARFDPVLFKDNVSNLRKKYRKIETLD
ncbi:exostosin-1b [Eurytemora carolleeae]|uniref:exostosin-1b n=1 Tax=Eurytemora carolleeae TaxID=1294199 RepID=UPI000C777E94|nr:exostosin-1b [Eurytemora carolleeae]|eukprot:XP_023327581.1 exostosin-1b-like [Eurytemora affinis]